MNQKNAFIVEREQSRTPEPLNGLSHINHAKLSGSDTGRTYAMMQDTTGPQAGPPLHRHNREDESFYVLEGHYRFEVDGQEIKAGPDTFVHAPRGTAHTFGAAGRSAGGSEVVAGHQARRAQGGQADQEGLAVDRRRFPDVGQRSCPEGVALLACAH